MRDKLIALTLVLTAFCLVVMTMEDVGLTVDEPVYNFPNSLRQAEWFQLAAKAIGEGDLARPFRQEVLTAYWKAAVPTLHPTLGRTLSGISWLLFHKQLGDIVAYRLASSLMFALIVGLLYLFIARAFTWREGLFAAIAYLSMPRVFGHAHLAALDTAITFMWFATAYAFYRGMTHKTWSIITGAIFGAALATKVHALFLPFPLFLWALWLHGPRKSLNNLVAMAIIAPIVWILVQPGLWYSLGLEGGQQAVEKVVSYTTRSSVPPVYYFGHTYTFSPPWHYAFVLALITVPPLVAVAYVIALLNVWRRNEVVLFCTVNALATLSLLLLPNAPGYHGVRLFLPAFPFLAGLAGIGVGYCLNYLAQYRLWSLESGRSFTRNAVTCVGYGLFFGSTIFSLLDSRPYYLSYFNSFIGGVKGAHALGMETTYWGDTINQEVLDFLNTETEQDASVIFIMSTLLTGEYYKKVNLLQRDVVYPPPKADYWILIPYQGTFDDYIWAVYKELKPFRVFSFKDTPMVLVYKKEDVLRQFWFLADSDRYYQPAK